MPVSIERWFGVVSATIWARDSGKNTPLPASDATVGIDAT
jgi:hypothetical protein